MKKPLLIIGFNRPDLIRQVIKIVKEYAPPRIYFACDGPRAANDEDFRLVEEVRKEMLREDWDCPVQTKFESSNIGLRDSMISAIDWFFSHENEGIILEDDCVPSLDFFNFMGFVLDTYRHEKKVWGATGSNLSGYMGDPNVFFSFISSALVWGWATWADRWSQFDRDLKDYESSGLRNNPKRWSDARVYHALDWHLSRLLRLERPDSWAYPWAWTVHYHGGLWAVPHGNLVQNVGFRKDATHTKKRLRLEQELTSISEITAPPQLYVNREFQREVHRRYHRVLEPLSLNKIRNLIRSLRYYRPAL